MVKKKSCNIYLKRLLKCYTSNIVAHGLFDHESKNILKSSIFLENTGFLYSDKGIIKHSNINELVYLFLKGKILRKLRY